MGLIGLPCRSTCSSGQCKHIFFNSTVSNEVYFNNTYNLWHLTLSKLLQFIERIVYSFLISSMCGCHMPYDITPKHIYSVELLSCTVYFFFGASIFFTCMLADVLSTKIRQYTHSECYMKPKSFYLLIFWTWLFLWKHTFFNSSNIKKEV